MSYHMLPTNHEFLIDDLCCIVSIRLYMHALLHDSVGPDRMSIAEKEALTAVHLTQYQDSFQLYIYKEPSDAGS